LIAEIRCDEKTIFIHHAELLERYIRKIALNLRATSLTDLYDKDLEKDAVIGKYFEKLNSQYKIIYKEEMVLKRRL